MKVRIPIMIDDPYTSRQGFKRDYEMVPAEEDFFLDGPVTRRVAVLDFDPATGALRPGARYVPPKKPGGEGSYEFAEPEDGHYEASFIQVSAFSTVLQTMYMFEEEDALGRPLTWAFDAPQLLVVPRAGEWANAFYERESSSLQLFYIPQDGKPPVYTCLSRDIIAHETAHAILDGIVPTLYHAITPQALALHEAIADLTAMLIAFRSPKLKEAVLRETEGFLADTTAFSTIAPQFGEARDLEGKAKYLRNLKNDAHLIDGKPGRVSRYEPHSLSQALSGALYAVLVRSYDEIRQKNKDWAPGRALFAAYERFKRMAFRALDHLPPGEVSFADYARAILAADQAAYPKENQEREWICDEFVRRGIVPGRDALRVETGIPFPGLAKVELEILKESDWAAYELVNQNREFFHVPKDASFHVYPRLKAKRKYYRKNEGAEPADARNRKGGNWEEIEELILKVSWSRQEPNIAGKAMPLQRQITVGTTISIDWKTREVRTCLTSDLGEEQRQDRDGMLKHLLEEGILRIGDEALGPDGKPLCAAIRAETLGGTMRVRGAARLLHITEEV